MNIEFQRQASDRGVYLVLAGLFLTMLVGLVFLALGVGFLTVSETRLQNATNFAALAALQAYQSKESDPTLDYGDKVEAARTRANEILSLNQIPGIAGDLGSLRHQGQNVTGATGDLEFGLWCHEEPEENTDPCAGGASYPFFKPNPEFPADGYTGTANAARVKIHVAGSNALINPLMSFFGAGDRAELAANATATIVQRCSVMVMDVSLSTTYETHHSAIAEPTKGPVNSIPAWIIPTPPSFPALPAYRKQWAWRLENGGPWAPVGTNYNGLMSTGMCRSGGGSGPDSWRADKLFYCGMATSQSCAALYGAFTRCITRPATGTVPHDVHFAKDYREMGSSIDTDAPPNGISVADSLLVDALEDGGYVGPQPFSRYMLAFNAALRSMQAQRVAGDRVAAVIMTGQKRDQVPDTGMAQDLGYLINLFNWRNRGTIDRFGAVVSPEVHPNAVDRGWVPLYSPGNITESSTNLVQGIAEAINVLANPLFCPETAQKSIMIATDGVGNCYWNGTGYQCAAEYAAYQNSEMQLALNSDSILSKLIAAKIAITFILDGNYVQPNIINRWYDKNGNSAKDPDEPYLDPDEAKALGYGGVGSSSGKEFVNFTSTPNDQGAYDSLGSPGVYFRRPNGVLSKMSMETGGIYCPLMDLCPNTTPGCDGECYIDHDGDPTTPLQLKESARVDGAMQLCAVQNMIKAEQAAKCAVDTLGRNPFVLVEQGQ